MVRTLFSALFALLIAAGGSWAEEIKGKVKSVDASKSTITVTVNDKDRTLTVAKDAKVFQLVGKKLKKAQPQDVPGGLAGLEAGKEVTVTTDKKDGQDVVTQIKVEGLAKKKKKDK
jgi:hypothetical protein